MLKMPKNTALSLALFVICLLALQTSAMANQDLPSQNWAPPLDAPIRLVNQFRQPNSDYSAGHRGVDYLAQIGRPVLAPAAGQIWYAGRLVNRSLVSIQHAGGILSEFEPVCTDLKKGEPVFQGQQIGTVCKPDAGYRQHCVSDSCLHFSIRLIGQYLSPQVFIGGLNPSRLLPIPKDLASLG